MPKSLLDRAESKVLAGSGACVLLSLFVDDLPNTLLVQMHGVHSGVARHFSLYAVYREEGITFEAAVRLEPGNRGRLLAGQLRAFVESEFFGAAIATPLTREVRAHFGR